MDSTPGGCPLPTWDRHPPGWSTVDRARRPGCLRVDGPVGLVLGVAGRSHERCDSGPFAGRRLSHRIAAGGGIVSKTLSRWRHGFEPCWDYKQRRRSDGPSRLSGESADPFVPHFSCGRPRHVAASEAETIALRPRFRTGPVEGLAVRESSRYASSILLQINAERVVIGLVKQVGLARSDICAKVAARNSGFVLDLLRA